MSADEALGYIILDFCKINNMSVSEFSRKSKVSRAYINRIIGNKLGKFGVSTTIKELIANGLGISNAELSDQIEQYQNNKQNIYSLSNSDVEEDELIVKINNKLKRLNSEQLKIVHDIITNSDSDKFELLNNMLENMK